MCLSRSRVHLSTVSQGYIKKNWECTNRNNDVPFQGLLVHFLLVIPYVHYRFLDGLGAVSHRGSHSTGVHHDRDDDEG